MKNVKYLIVGCGRSGTGFMSHAVSLTGKSCGHENVFHVSGIDASSPLEFECSWYAVPHLSQIPRSTRILHLVRNPQSVIRSFYRIGLFAPTIAQHASCGRPKKFAKTLVTDPSAFLSRIRYVHAHRQFFRNYTDVMDTPCEIARANRYWTHWNTRIENHAANTGADYLRVRLEDVHDRSREIAAFLGLPRLPLNHQKKNAKVFYERAELENLWLSPETEQLSRHYGYNTVQAAAA